MAKRATAAKSNITIQEIEQAIHVIRGQRVMLDSDIAAFYDVPTRRINEQVSRNQERFPDDFAFSLTQQELTSLISQTAISNSGSWRSSNTALGI